MFRKFLRFLGVDLAEGTVFPLRMRSRILAFVCLAAVLFFLGGAAFFWQSSKSWFCGTCHVMRPYVQSWRESVHGAKGVECVACHFPPGVKNAIAGKWQAASMLMAFITGTYNTTFVAEVQDASCMRSGCHEQQLLEGEVKFKGVGFDHKHHLGDLRRGKRLRCTSCHSQMVQGSHITVTESVCFTCHFKDLKRGRVEEPLAGCKGCHDVPDKPVKLATGGEYNHQDYEERQVACHKCHFDSVQGDGAVARQVCIACHSEPERLEKFDDHEFMHKMHVSDHKVECFQCHAEIRHGRDPEPEPSDPICNRCHVGKHNYTEQVYRGTGARGVKDMPSSMWASRVHCIACHQILGGLAGHAPHSTYEAGEKSCIECHGEAVEGALASWKEEVAAAVEQASASLSKAEQAARGLADADKQREAAGLIDDARHNIELIRYGRGVHNVEYAQAALEAASASAAKVVEMAGPE